MNGFKIRLSDWFLIKDKIYHYPIYNHWDMRPVDMSAQYVYIVESNDFKSLQIGSDCILLLYLTGDKYKNIRRIIKINNMWHKNGELYHLYNNNIEWTDKNA